MTADGNLRIEYVEARRVLLEALVALQPHAEAEILIGAQAVYLKTADRMPSYQAFTTDADLAIDPGQLAATPLLEDALAAAGFNYSGEPGIWTKRVQRPNEAGDQRRVNVRVAGPAALTVAKAHKLGERLDTPHRLQAKDAGDVYRLFDATSVADMAVTARRLLADERSASTVLKALDYLRQLFATPRSPGTQLATQALSTIIDESTATTFVTGYTQELIHQIQP